MLRCVYPADGTASNEGRYGRTERGSRFLVMAVDATGSEGYSASSGYLATTSYPRSHPRRTMNPRYLWGLAVLSIAFFAGCAAAGRPTEDSVAAFNDSAAPFNDSIREASLRADLYALA